MSFVGSLLCLAYFVVGKNDSVGILAYLLPSVVSVYNLRLELMRRRRPRDIIDSESSNQPVQRTGASRSAHEPNGPSPAVCVSPNARRNNPHALEDEARG